MSESDLNLDSLRDQVAEELGQPEEAPIKRAVTQRLVVRRMNPEVSFADDTYTVEQAMNYFPGKNEYSYPELQKLYAEGIQISIRS